MTREQIREYGRVSLLLGGVLISFIKPASICAQGRLPAPTIFRNAKPSVVVVIGGNGDSISQGSGFIVGHDRIVTNHHVLAGSTSAMVVFADGKTAEVSSVWVDSASNDLTVLVARTGDRPSLHLGDESKLEQGDTVYAIGAPEGLQLTLTNGIVSAFRNQLNHFVIQSTAVIGHGSSGGPLLDQQGNVVGITTLLFKIPGIYFSVTVGDLKHLLRTPEVITLPFAEWAKENAEAETSSSPTETDSDAAEHIQRLLQDKKYDQAEASIQKLLTRSPNSALAHRLNGELHEMTGDTDSAIRELGISVAQMPTDGIGQFYYALALFEKRRFGAALEHEIRSNELTPSKEDESFLALLYYATRDYSRAGIHARKRLKADPADETALGVLAGLAYWGITDQDEAWSQIARRIATIDENSFWVHMSRGMEAYKRNQVQGGDAELLKAEDSDFPDVAPYLMLAESYERAGEITRANDQIKNGLVSVPFAPKLLAAGTFISLRSRDRGEAARRFASLQSADPDSATTESTGCLYYYGIDQGQTALPYCARSIEKVPNSQTAFSNHGWAELDSGEFAAALRDFSTADEMATRSGKQRTKVQNIDNLWGLVVSNYGLGERNQVEKYLRAIRDLYPDAGTINGLEQLPLLWSATTLRQIGNVLNDFSR